MTSIGVGTSNPFEDDSQRLVNRRQVTSLKLNVENGTDNLHDFTDVMTVGAHFPLGVDILSLNSSFDL